MLIETAACAHLDDSFCIIAHEHRQPVASTDAEGFVFVGRLSVSPLQPFMTQSTTFRPFSFWNPLRTLNLTKNLLGVLHCGRLVYRLPRDQKLC